MEGVTELTECPACGKINPEYTICDWCYERVCFKRDHDIHNTCYMWVATFDGKYARAAQRVCNECFAGDA